MTAINYFEGLPEGSGADPAELDPARVASVEAMGQIEDKLLDLAGRMAVVRLQPETRAALGVVTTSEATEVMLCCGEIVRDDPSLAEEVGDSQEAWAQVIGAAMSYGDVAEAIAPLCAQARANEAVLLSALSGDAKTVLAAVQRRVDDEGAPIADRDVLRYRFARIDEEERLAEDGRRTRGARGARRSELAAAEIAGIEGVLDNVLHGIAAKRQLREGRPVMPGPSE